MNRLEEACALMELRSCLGMGIGEKGPSKKKRKKARETPESHK